MLLVVHIPKTAGTSFRIALASQFGAGKIALDYGGQSDVTSPLVLQHLYAKGADKDISALVGDLRQAGVEALVGHFNCLKYEGLFNPTEVVAFVREPLVRLCSEYLHRVRRETVSGSFAEFVENPSFQNMQSKTLVGRPDGMFIGITERYRESLQVFNLRYGLSLGHKRRNRGIRGGGLRMAGELDKNLVNRFNDLNQVDLELYRDVREKFAQLFEGSDQAGKGRAALGALRWTGADRL